MPVQSYWERLRVDPRRVALPSPAANAAAARSFEAEREAEREALVGPFRLAQARQRAARLEAEQVAAELEGLRRGGGLKAGASVRFELRAAAAEGKISGYGSVFGVKDSFNDVVEPGAFKETLAEHARKGRRVPMLWMHDLKKPIGLWTKLEEDAKGLFVEGQVLSEVEQGREALVLLDSGAVSGLSIGFNLRPGGATYDPAAKVRRVTAVELWEVSLVSFPANDDARVE